MNTNPTALRILCFGDSNTWGRIPGDDNTARFPANKRWTGVLQDKLGEGYEIIEEGLNGRTTDKESPYKAGKNGAGYLYSCLESHNPLDLIILAIGKNELKAQYNSSPESIGEGIEKCIEEIKEEGKNLQGTTPKILLIPPAVIEEKNRLRWGKMVNDFEGGKEKSIKLVSVCRNIAKKYNLDFFDVNDAIKVSEVDGVHLDEKAHKIIAEEICKKVREILKRELF